MSLIYTYDDYRFFNDKLSEWYISLLMAMSVIASYVICMRASSGIRYVVQRTFGSAFT